MSEILWQLQCCCCRLTQSRSLGWAAANHCRQGKPVATIAVAALCMMHIAHGLSMPHALHARAMSTSFETWAVAQCGNHRTSRGFASPPHVEQHRDQQSGDCCNNSQLRQGSLAQEGQHLRHGRGHSCVDTRGGRLPPRLPKQSPIYLTFNSRRTGRYGHSGAGRE